MATLIKLAVVLLIGVAIGYVAVPVVVQSLGAATPTTNLTAIVKTLGLAVGTTTPTTNAEVNVSSTGTSTIYVVSSDANKGGCLQIEATGGTTYRAYATTTGPLILMPGSCK